jgi:hypothetical protein
MPSAPRRIFSQGAKLVDQSLQSGSLFESDLWARIVARGQTGQDDPFSRSVV